MNQKRYRKIFSVIFISLIFIYLIICICSFIMEQSVQTDKKTSGWNAKADYPVQAEIVESIDTKKVSLINRAVSIFQGIRASVKNYATSKNSLYTDIAILRKGIERYIYGYNVTTSLSGTVNNLDDPRDLVVLHKSGYLSFVYDDVDTTAPMENIQEFNQYLSARGIDLLLFIPPYKSGEIDSTYRGVYHDYSEELLESIVEQAHHGGVDVINFMDTAEAEGLTEEQLYFRTDHHWLPQSGLLGCMEISPWLIERGYDIDTELFDLNNYNINYAEHPMLGSQGIKATAAYTDIEYMPILEPLYSTDLTVTNPQAGTVLYGSIEDTLYDYEMLKTPSLDSTKHYQFYSYGDPPLLQIHNNRRTDGKRILVIKDSFARVMVPYMSNMAEYVDVIDLRHFDGSLKTYMEENTPDSVIVVYAVGTFVDKSHYVKPSQYAFNFE